MLAINQVFQYLAWLIALVQFIIGLYVVYLEPRGFAHRCVSFSLIIIAVDTFLVGVMANTQSAVQGELGKQILTALSGTIVATTLLASLAIFQPTIIIRKSNKRLVWAILLLGLLPVVLTLIDVLFGTQLWYPGKNPEFFTTGNINLIGDNAAWRLPWLSVVIYALLGIPLLALLAHTILFNHRVSREARFVAVWLLLASLLTLFSALGSFRIAVKLTIQLIGSLLYLLAYVITAFSPLIAEQKLLRRGRLQVRLTVLALIIAIPLLVGMSIFLTQHAQAVIASDAALALNASNRSILDSAEMWITYNTRALRTLVGSPDIISMDPTRQATALQSLVSTYPDIYLASTTDTSGMNISRSDSSQPVNYKDRTWFQGAVDGQPITYQTMVGGSGQPTVVISMPIRRSDGRILGVGMIASDLRVVSRILGQAVQKTDATVLLVNSENRILASTGQPVGILMEDISAYPPVESLRSGVTQNYEFTDINNVTWRANLSLLSNGWGVIVQQTEESLFFPVRSFQRISLTVILVGTALLFVLTWLTIREVLHPVQSLTDTAAAITAGDLSQKAQVSGEDELGVLAASFNTMTSQLRELIGSLESRVNERTHDLERRALQLQVTAQVARRAAAIRDPDELLQDAVKLISEKFDYYHAGIFLIDQISPSSSASSGETDHVSDYAVLCAASSEGGRRMLERGHRLRVGQQGIVGLVAGTGVPRIALETDKDTAYFGNPDLPLTRSEIALPLKIGNRVIGVLDVQSEEVNAFDQENLETLQILADQLALALENARLLDQSKQALRELEDQFSQQIRKGWSSAITAKQLPENRLGYWIGPQGLQPIAKNLRTTFMENPEDPSATSPEITVPIELRNQKLGALRLRRREELGAWTEQDQALIQEVVAQMALALENARLLDEIRDRARREELINQVVSNAQNSLSLEGAMRSTVEEVIRVFNVSRARIRLGDVSKGNGDKS